MNENKCNEHFHLLMTMDFRAILAFITVVESGNLYCASIQLGCSQPAVSIYLNRVRGYFPKPLFSREGRNLVPTDYAVILSSKLKESLGDFQKIVLSHKILERDMAT